MSHLLLLEQFSRFKENAFDEKQAGKNCPSRVWSSLSQYSL